MQVKRRRRKSDCPIHFALEHFGDPWSLLIVRDLMFKQRSTYGEFLDGEERIATNILADRLARLQRDGIVAAEGRRYRLTKKGLDLVPVLLEIIAWSARHDERTAATPGFVRRVRRDREGLEREIRARVREEGGVA